MGRSVEKAIDTGEFGHKQRKYAGRECVHAQTPDETNRERVVWRRNLGARGAKLAKKPKMQRFLTGKPVNCHGVWAYDNREAA